MTVDQSAGKEQFDLKQHTVNQTWKLLRKLIHGLVPLGCAFGAFAATEDPDTLVIGALVGIGLAFLITRFLPNPKTTAIDRGVDTVSKVLDS